MNQYLGNLKETEVRNLQELVDWNKAHAKEALTDGRDLLSFLILVY